MTNDLLTVARLLVLKYDDEIENFYLWLKITAVEENVVKTNICAVADRL